MTLKNDSQWGTNGWGTCWHVWVATAVVRIWSAFGLGQCATLNAENDWLSNMAHGRRIVIRLHIWPLVLIGAYSHAGPVVMMLLRTVNFNHCGTLVSTWLDHSGEQAASVLLQAPYLVRKICHLKTLRVYVCWFDPGSLGTALTDLRTGTSLWGRPRKLHRKPEKLRRSHFSIFCH